MKNFTNYKQIIFIISIMPVILWASVVLASQDDPLKTPNVSTPPIIDGIGDDGCWQNVNWQTIDQAWIPYGASVDADDYSGRYKIVWSSQENVLYFLVEITDDVIVDGFIQSATEQENYNYDVLEVFIDEDKSGGRHVFDGTGSTGQQWGTNAENAFSYHIYADCPEDNNVTTQCNALDSDGTGWGDRTFPDYSDHFPEFALRKTGNVYTREFSLIVYNDTYENDNKEGSRAQLQEGKIIGLSLAYCDNDNPDESPKTRDNFFGSVWVTAAAYNDHWMDADDYGTVELTGYAPLPLVVDFNGDGILDIDDHIILIECWGTDDPLCDIAPQPDGDGIVDRLDLELFMNYWEQENCPKEVHVVDADSQVPLELGQILVVTLESNPSTGYQWEVVEDPNSILEQIGDSEFVQREQTDPPMVGAGGWEIFRFKAVNTGQMNLQLVYRRTWETDVEPINTFSIDVVVN